MIVDASAMLAILNEEPEWQAFRTALGSATEPLMSVANHLEVAIKVDRDPNPASSRVFQRVMDAARIELAPITVEQAAVARSAYRDFGKGSGHPAQLNFGDCFAYALASTTGKPLLYKGNNFTHTDIRPAI